MRAAYEVSPDCQVPGCFRILQYARWSTRAFALRDEVRLDQTGIRSWRVGKSSPSTRTLHILCDLTGATADELLGRVPLTPERLAACAAHLNGGSR